MCVCVLNPQKMQRAQGSFLLLHSHCASHGSSISTTSSAPLLRHQHPFWNISGIFYNPEINIWKEAAQQLLWPVTNRLFQCFSSPEEACQPSLSVVLLCTKEQANMNSVESSRGCWVANRLPVPCLEASRCNPGLPVQPSIFIGPLLSSVTGGKQNKMK